MQLTESSPDLDDHSERHFNRGAWLTLIAAIILLVWPLIQVGIALDYPVDGWASAALVDEGSRTGPFPLEFALTNEPTDLKMDDIVTAIDGRALAEGQLPPLTPPWVAGQPVRYSVLREGIRLNVDLVLMDADISTVLVYMVRSPWVYTVVALAWLLTGVVVFFLRPRYAATNYLLIIGAFAAGTTIMEFVNSGITFYSQPVLVINLATLYQTGAVWVLAISVLLFVLVFPVPLWPLKNYPRLVPLLAYGLAFSGLLFAMPRYPTLIPTPLQGLVGVIVTFGTFLAVLIAVAWSFYYNLRHSRDPVARAQFRWLGLGLILGVTPFFLVPVVFSVLWQSETAVRLVGTAERVATLMTLALPIALAFGILRYRLFDIDVIIRRTTSYAILTGILLLVYLGSIVVLQRVLSPITGDSDAAVVLSTLLIAALFLPLRRRVQGVIDRRFFRSKYDAEKVLEQFAATVRDETDLDALTAELVRVIQDTMQPEFVSVWLKPNVDRQPANLVKSE